MLFRLVAVLTAGCLLMDGLAFAKKQKKKKKEEEVTQVLELPKDPPQAVIAQTERLVFFNSSLSAKGLLSQQIRDAIKSLWSAGKGAQIVKVRAFVAGSGDMRRVPAIVSEMFTEKKMALPAVSVVQVGSLPLDGAQVVLEAMAQDKKPVNPTGISFMPGFKIGEGDPRTITCYMASLEKTNDLRSKIAGAHPKAVVNFVQIRRDTVGEFYQCEAIAAGQGVSGKIAITGTQLAFGSGEQDLRLAFGRLEKALMPLNTKLANAVWAEFYPLSSKAVESLRKVQPEFFHLPEHPLLVFEGLPSMDAQFGVEVITKAN